MGRKVQVRVSYMNDARFILRLVEAYEKDVYLPIEDKKQVIQYLKASANILLTAKSPLVPQ